MTRVWLAAFGVAAAFAAAPAAAQMTDAERAVQGKGVYQRHCVQCHGPEHDGRGIHAPRLKPPPSNLATSSRTDDYRLQIITVGGRSMGRSAMMPEWGLELSAQEILAVVVYLREVSEQTAARAKAKGGSSAVARGARTHG